MYEKKNYVSKEEVYVTGRIIYQEKKDIAKHLLPIFFNWMQQQNVYFVFDSNTWYADVNK